MFLVEGITNDPLQRHNLSLEEGDQVDLVLYFISLQRAWFIKELRYRDFEARNIKLVNSPNLLNQYINLIPFGLACITPQKRELSNINDFTLGGTQLFVLTADETREVVRGFQSAN